MSEASDLTGNDNLVSNELRYQMVIPELARIAPPGRACIGVGPEQNFTYISVLRPAIAFIVDIRRGNLHLHLLYKAIFELAADRVEFVSLLFSRPRPWRFDARSTVEEIFTAYRPFFPNDRLSADTAAAIRRQLVVRDGLPLPDADLQGVEDIRRAFVRFGPGIRYGASLRQSGGAPSQPTYADLMTAVDAQGVPRSFLASDQAFAFVKRLEERNLIVPLVGDFAGPKTLRAVGAYLRPSGASVSAFYVSNVEEYLRLNRTWPAFCDNVAALPLDDASVFIRSMRGTPRDPASGLLSTVAPIAQMDRCQ